MMTSEKYFEDYWQEANREKFGNYGDYNTDDYAIAFANDYAEYRLNHGVSHDLGERLSSDQLMTKARKDVAYKYLDDKGKTDFESGVLTGYGWAFE